MGFESDETRPEPPRDAAAAFFLSFMTFVQDEHPSV